MYRSATLTRPAIVVLTVMLSGCISPSEQRGFAQRGIDSGDNVSRSIIAGSAAQQGADREYLARYSESLEGRIHAQQALLEQAIQEAAESRRMFKQTITSMAAIAARLTGVPIPNFDAENLDLSAVLGPIILHLDKALADETGAVSKSLSEETRAVAKSLSEETRAVADRVTAIEDDRRLAEAALDPQQEVDRLSREAALAAFRDELSAEMQTLTEAERQAFETEVASLQEQLAGLPVEEQKTEVLAILDEAGFDPELLDLVKEMDDDTLETLLGVSGTGGVGLITLFALRRTYGKSRSQADIDRIGQRLEDAIAFGTSTDPLPTPHTKQVDPNEPAPQATVT